MRLQTVKIQDFRSIRELSLSLTSNLYCLVGKNEVGKSNILKAISLLAKDGEPDQSKPLDKLSPQLAITGEFEPSDTDRKSIRDSGLPLTTSAGTSYNTSAMHSVIVEVKGNIRSISLRMADNNIVTQNLSRNAADWTKLTYIIDAMIPSIQLFERETFLVSPFSLEQYKTDPKNPSLQTFIKIFRLGGLSELNLLETDSIEDIVEIREIVAGKVNDLLKKYYRQDSSIQIKIESHAAKFTLHFKDQFNRLNQFENRSTGFQYFFSFLINKIYSNEFENSSIFLLDEPALSLHPTGQKDFVKILEEVSKKNQVLYTTHSPFSINRLKPSNVWVIEKDSTKGTFLNFKPFHKNWRPLRSSLGIDISDSFFYGERTLIVEGAEDRLYIFALINYFVRKSNWKVLTDLISIVDAGSISNIPAMIQILLEEDRRLVVLMDSDDTRIFNQAKKKEEKTKNLVVHQISDVSKEAISIEDILPLELYKVAVSKYIENLLGENVIIPAETFKAIDLSKLKGSKRYTAIASEILSNFTDADKNPLDKKTPISKVGIAHEFDKLLQSDPTLSTEDLALPETLIRQLLHSMNVLREN